MKHLINNVSLLHSLYHGFELWLDDRRLNRFQQIRPDDFQVQYSLNQLAATLANNWTYWTEYIDLSEVRKVQRDEAIKWLRICFRYVPPERQAVISARGTKPANPKESIIRQLNSYDKPVPPPKICIETPLIKQLPLNELKKSLNYSFDKVVKMSKNFNMTVKELSSLDSSYKEALQALHMNKSKKELKEFRCNSLVTPCKGSVFKDVEVRIPTKLSFFQQKLKITICRFLIMK